MCCSSSDRKKLMPYTHATVVLPIEGQIQQMLGVYDDVLDVDAAVLGCVCMHVRVN